MIYLQKEQADALTESLRQEALYHIEAVDAALDRTENAPSLEKAQGAVVFLKRAVGRLEETLRDIQEAQKLAP